MSDSQEEEYQGYHSPNYGEEDGAVDTHTRLLEYLTIVPLSAYVSESFHLESMRRSGNVMTKDRYETGKFSTTVQKILIWFSLHEKYNELYYHDLRIFLDPAFIYLLEDGFILSSKSDKKFYLDLDHPTYGPNFISKCHKILEECEKAYEIKSKHSDHEYDKPEDERNIRRIRHLSRSKTRLHVAKTTLKVFLRDK